ncbi:MAG: CHASE2 domain-containing protein, partial [Phycisphaerae bacterium]
MKRRRWIGGRTPGLLIGGLVTSLLAGLYAGGMLDRLALYWLDVHFRHFNHIAASDRILMIDINDYAVERIHRWPWPRRLHAELVTALEEFGAAAVLMDIVFAEPMAPRFDHPALSPDMEVDPPGDVRGMVSFEDRIVDDQELADALRAAGNVYLAMFYQHRPPGIAPRPADSSPQPDALLPSSDAGQRKRIQRLLLDDFSLGRDALAKQLNLPPEQIEKHMAPAKRSAARKLVHTLLEANPKTTFAEVRAALLPHEPHERMSPDREDVLRAYRAMRALRAVTSSCPRVPATLKGRLERAINPTPPLDVLAESARAVAFVTFRPDTDGVVRRLPLVVDLDGFLVPQ